MKTKEEIIGEAWVSEIGEEKYNEVKHLIDEEGYLDNSGDPYLKMGDFKEQNTVDYYDNEILRPKSLNNVSTNNGWIIIDNTSAPKETDKYWVVRNGVIDVGVYNKGVDKWLCTGQYYFATQGDLKITHYQPIIKPQPPIY